MLSILCHFHGLLFARQMLDKPNAATQCNVPHSTRDAHRYSSLVNKYIGDLSSNESRSFRDWSFWGLILWSSLSGEFISIPKGVIGMDTTCEDKSRAVPRSHSEWSVVIGSRRMALSAGI